MKNRFERIDSTQFDEHGQIKQYSKLIFMSEEYERKFFESDPGVQKAVLSIIKQTAKEMQLKIQREMEAKKKLSEQK